MPGRAARGEHDAEHPLRVERGHLGRGQVVGDQDSRARLRSAPRGRRIRAARGPSRRPPRARRRRGPRRYGSGSAVELGGHLLGGLEPGPGRAGAGVDPPVGVGQQVGVVEQQQVRLEDRGLRLRRPRGGSARGCARCRRGPAARGGRGSAGGPRPGRRATSESRSIRSRDRRTTRRADRPGRAQRRRAARPAAAPSPGAGAAEPVGARRRARRRGRRVGRLVEPAGGQRQHARRRPARRPGRWPAPRPGARAARPSVATRDRLAAGTHADPVVTLRSSTAASPGRTCRTSAAAGRACRPCGLATSNSPVTNSPGDRRPPLGPASGAGRHRAELGLLRGQRRPPPRPPPRPARPRRPPRPRPPPAPRPAAPGDSTHPLPQLRIEQVQRQLGGQHGAAQVHQHDHTGTVVDLAAPRP